MKCPQCQKECRVINSRDRVIDGYETKARRRECKPCNYRWDTFEMDHIQYAKFKALLKLIRRLKDELKTIK